MGHEQPNPTDAAPQQQAETHQDEITRLEQRGVDLAAQAGIDQQIIASLTEQGILDRSRIEHLEAALVASRQIGAAMGILMAAHKETEEEAFNRLRTNSQNTHRKLRDIARDVLYTGSL